MTQASRAAPPADLARRFGGVTRAYGQRAAHRFRQAQVMVIGVGGVGSWAVEALARSGIGHLTLVDLDHVAESNVNRQIHALDGHFGRAKVEVLAARVAAINPTCEVRSIDDFVTADNVTKLIDGCQQHIIDCIDDSRAKAALLAHCREQGVATVTVGGAGGRIDPLRTRQTDLALSRNDALLSRVRSLLRTRHQFPRRGRFGIPCVFSEEPVRYPAEDGEIDFRKPAGVSGLSCAGGLGSVMTVTATFGLAAAAEVLRSLAEE